MDQLGTVAQRIVQYASRQQPISAATHEHERACEPVNYAIVTALRSRVLDIDIPNEYVADYVHRSHGRFVGFAAIDPTDADWKDRFHKAQGELGLRGLTVCPIAQDVHPASSSSMRLYELAQQHRMPVMIYNRRPFSLFGPAPYGQPILWDEVLEAFPNVAFVFSSVDLPWMQETVWMLAKHGNAFAEVSAVLGQPWMTYTALTWAQELGVLDRLLFGSGFPFGSSTQGIESLYRLHEMVAGSNLPTIPRQRLQAIIERDSLQMLGLGNAVRSNSSPSSVSSVLHDDDS